MNPANMGDAHIVRRYDEDLAQLQALIDRMGRLAAAQVEAAVDALQAADVGAARRVVHLDRQLNHMDMDAKERVVALFAVRAPVARDLRLVISLHNVIDVLERIGDEAKAIASIVIRLFDEEHLPQSSELMCDLTHMGRLAAEMLGQACQAIGARRLDDAIEVIRRDEEMNAEFRSSLRRLATFLLEDPRNLKYAIDMVFVYKSLERIGDYAKNLGELLIYVVKGKDVRYMNAENLASGYLDD